MGGFFKSIAKLGLTGAATLAGGPAAGAAAAGGMGALKGLKQGGTLGDMLMGAGTGAGGAYLGGQLAPVDKPMSIYPSVPEIPTFDPTLQSPSLLEALKFNY